MKITCERCDAKYSIADDKVAGRAFRIRCKKCGAAMVVRGAATAADAADASRSPEGPWHVFVDGEPDGPMSRERVAALVAGRTIDAETLVWREGHDDWVRLADAPELAGLLPAAEPRADLFAPDAASPFAPSASGDAADASSSQPLESEALTGARNESSVLFSLANLQALSGAAAARSSGPSVERTATSAATTEQGSGLIDIRALAAAPVAARTSSNEPDADIDALLPFAASASPLGAPVVMPEPERTTSRAPIVAGVAVAVVAVAAAAVAIVWIGKAAPPPSTPEPVIASRELLDAEDAMVGPGANATAPGSARVQATGDGDGVTPSRIERDEPTADPSERRVASPEAAPAANPERLGTADRPAATPSERADRPNARPVATRRAPTEEREAPSPRRPAPPPVTEGDPIASILDPRAAPSRPSPSRPTGPQTPSRADVVAAMNGVSAAVRACGDGSAPMVTVRIAFAGDTGHVTSAEVRDSSASPPVRSCVARAVRAATVPPFVQRSFTVSFPFRL